MNELVSLKNNEAVCSSLDVAKKFNKRHDNVLNGIRGLLKNEDTHKMFKLSHYVEEQNGQSYPMYLMNRDGFSLLVMGFTGKAALEWKLKYIEAFNKMETIIREKSSEAWLTTRQTGKISRRSETDAIKDLVEYAKAQGSGHADMLYMTYSKLANKMTGIESRETATIAQLNNLNMIENIILCVVREGIAKQLPYKQIYQDCKRRLELVKELAYLGTAV